MTQEKLQSSSEEQAKIQKERTMSDAKFLEGGAEYIGDSEGGYRLEVTSGQRIERHREMEKVFSRREEEKFGKMRREIRNELDELPMEEIIKSHPELSGKLEAIHLDREGRDISLFRDKRIPELAFMVWSKSKHRGGTRGRVLLDVPEPRLPDGLEVEFRSVCACCGSETYGLESPFRKNLPEYPTKKKREGESDSETDARYENDLKEYREAHTKWENSEDKQKDIEWEKQQKQEYKETVQKACTDNGIKYLVMRKGTPSWKSHYGNLEGVEMLEVTNDDRINAVMDELRTKAGLAKEKVPPFSFSG